MSNDEQGMLNDEGEGMSNIEQGISNDEGEGMSNIEQGISNDKVFRSESFTIADCS